MWTASGRSASEHTPCLHGMKCKMSSCLQATSSATRALVGKRQAVQCRRRVIDFLDILVLVSLAWRGSFIKAGAIILAEDSESDEGYAEKPSTLTMPHQREDVDIRNNAICGHAAL